MIPLSIPDTGETERAAVDAALAAGHVAQGPQIGAFETAFAHEAGSRHALAVSSGTAALHLALRVLGVGPGDAVITPSFTFIGGVAPILYQGAEPVFVDCEPATWGLDPALLPEAFALARAKGLKVRAVIAADLYGQCCDMAAISAFCEAEGAPLVMDCAESVGARLNAEPAGRGAVMAAWSFNGNKIITTGGGGMLTSDDEALIARARKLSAAAREPAPHYEHVEVGYNYRMSAVAAAIGLAQLETLEQKVARRRAVFETYRAELDGLPGVRFQSEAPGRRHTRWLSVMLLDPAHAALAPEALCESLMKAGVEARRTWKPMHMQPVFARALRVGGAVSEGVFAEGVCLPSGSSLSPDDQARVCEAIRERLA